MRKSFDFGKVDFYGRGRKINRVTVEVELREDKEGRPVFSAVGNVWNGNGSDIVMGGQCLDELKKYIHHPKYNKIYRLWTLYHLNDMNASCEHQEALGWKEKASEKVVLYNYTMTLDAIRERDRIKDFSLKKLQEGEAVHLTGQEQFVLSLGYSIHTHEEKLSANISKYYKLNNTESKALGWLYEKDHPEGILGKACPVCGYEYGSGWMYRSIPAEDLKIINELLEG